MGSLRIKEEKGPRIGKEKGPRMNADQRPSWARSIPTPSRPTGIVL